MGRFDYVKYDALAIAAQDGFKAMVIELETHIDGSIRSRRARLIALEKLEEVYMWIGKGIRDDQIKRGFFLNLQEERTNS